jgi:hypothetical protein
MLDAGMPMPATSTSVPAVPSYANYGLSFVLFIGIHRILFLRFYPSYGSEVYL